MTSPDPAGDPAQRPPMPPASGPLPADGHVHTQFSYDTDVGDMVATCARAVELGVPAVAFTEHVDLTPWILRPQERAHLPAPMQRMVPPDGGELRAPVPDLDAYLACVAQCRERFPGLRILTGLELGEPHWHLGPYASLADRGRVDRVLGSLHSLPGRGGFAEVHSVLNDDAAAGGDRYATVRRYLAELESLAASAADFDVLAHVDFVARYWPAGVAMDFERVQDEYRAVLGALARSGRALEVNTQLPLPVQVLWWWRDSGGREVTFGSDAHEPLRLAHGFTQAAAMAEAVGFRPGRDPWQPWRR